MPDYKSLTHTLYVVFIPKRRQKVICGRLRKCLGNIFQELAKRIGCEILEEHLMRDHVHMYQYFTKIFSITSCWLFKDKCAIAIARHFK